MISHKQAHTFATSWIESWNRHDLDSVMSHYADDVEYHSPFVARLFNEPTGVIKRKSQVRSYLEKGLASYPDLYFQLFHVFLGVSSLALSYQSVNNLLATEVFELNEEGLISRVLAHYTESTQTG